jgi:hypothetical protein
VRCLTRVYQLPPGLDPRAEPELLHEFDCFLPVQPEGALLTVNGTCWRIRYVGVTVEERQDRAVLVYSVQPWREEPRT